MAANRITVEEWKALHGGRGRRKVAKQPKVIVAPKRPVRLMKPTWRVDGDAIEFVIPVRVVTLENQRKHWKAKATQAAKQKKQAFDALWWAYNASWFDATKVDNPLGGWLIVPDVEGAKVTLTRYGVGRLDSGNIEGCFKHIQDGIAEWLGIDDGHDDVAWRYAQRKSDHYGVEVRIEPLKKEPANG